MLKPSSSVPPFPSTVGLVGSWGVLGNANPIGYPAGNAACNTTDANTDGRFLNFGDPLVSPYPADWASFLSNDPVPPCLIDTLFDQTTANDLSASGSARPVLRPAIAQISSVLVTASPYFGQMNGKSAYGASDPTVTGIYWNGSAWLVRSSSSTVQSSSDDTSFPSQATFDTGTVTADTNGGGWVQGSSSTGMVTALGLFDAGSQTGTINLLVYISDLVGTSILTESGAGTAGQGRRLSIMMVAGVLTCSIYDGTAVVCLPNTKIKTISAVGWYNIAFEFDTTQVTAANQTTLKVNNSATGVTSPASANCFGLAICGGGNNSTQSFMARDAGGTLSLGFPGQVLQAQVYSDVKSAGDLTTIFNWLTYAAGTQGITIG